jgi:hypothetical protein
MLWSQPVIVWLSSRVMQSMSEYAQGLSPLENGGILLGWRSGEDRIIADLRGPGLSHFTGDISSCRITSCAVSRRR